jgi:hypothetical protein
MRAWLTLVVLLGVVLVAAGIGPRASKGRGHQEAQQAQGQQGAGLRHAWSHGRQSGG